MNISKSLITALLCGFLIHNSLVEALPGKKHGYQEYTNYVSLPTPTDNQLREMEIKLICLINHERAKFKLPVLREWGVLSSIAKTHSRNMAQKKIKVGHGGFDQRFEVVKPYASKKIVFGENVAFNQFYKDPLKVAVDGWMKSEGHRKNILSDYDETGMGICCSKDGGFYMTQLFSKRS